jgi:hypothetical protein
MTICCISHSVGEGVGAVRSASRRAAAPFWCALDHDRTTTSNTHLHASSLGSAAARRDALRHPTGTRDDAEWPAAASRQLFCLFIIYFLLCSFFIYYRFIYLFILYYVLLWLALYGAGLPPEPSGQAEAEQVR